MRVRTDAKRQEIVDVAGELFEELGYDRTSMSLISQRVGGSKATLYGYFKSKEELLLAVLDVDVNVQADRLMDHFLAAPSLRDALVILGVAYMHRRLDTRPIANVRMMAAQPESAGIGAVFYENVLGPAWQRLADRFQILMDEGRLRQSDPWVMAMHWKGLCEWDLFEKRLIGAIREVEMDDLRKISELAADAFLILYGPQEGKDEAAKVRDDARSDHAAEGL